MGIVLTARFELALEPPAGFAAVVRAQDKALRKRNLSGVRAEG